MSDDRLKQMQENFLKKRMKIDEIKASFDELDAVVNFKVNSELKKEFDRICKKSHSNLSRELKLYMLRIVSQGNL